MGFQTTPKRTLQLDPFQPFLGQATRNYYNGTVTIATTTAITADTVTTTSATTATDSCCSN